MSKLFDKISKAIPDETNRYIARCMDVSDQITEILKRKGITQRQLAEELGKNESEISKWLSGNHNFTLRTLAKIESVLNEDVLIAPMYWKEYDGMFALNEGESSFKVTHQDSSNHIKYIFIKERQETGKAQYDMGFDDIVPDKVSTGKVRELYPKGNPRIMTELWKKTI